MDLKKYRKKAVVKERKKTTLHLLCIFCRCRVVLLRCFISALFLYFFKVHPYSKWSFSETFFSSNILWGASSMLGAHAPINYKWKWPGTNYKGHAGLVLLEAHSTIESHYEISLGCNTSVYNYGDSELHPWVYVRARVEREGGWSQNWKRQPNSFY